MHVLKDPDFSLLFLPLTQRLPVPLWIHTGEGGSWCWQWGPGGWDLCRPAYEQSFAHSGKMSFWETLSLCGRLRQAVTATLAVADFMALVGVIIKLLR